MKKYRLRRASRGGGFFGVSRCRALHPISDDEEAPSSVHETGAEAVVSVGAATGRVGTGRRIAGIAIGIDRACVGVHGFVGARTGAVIPPVLGRRGDCSGTTGRRVACRRVAGVIHVVSRAGHRTQHDRGQDQRGKTQRRRPFGALVCSHCMTIPFGQGPRPSRRRMAASLPGYFARCDPCRPVSRPAG